ncbi:uncharacterized protein EAE98_008535 [Botrytis deweyae]|uniref:Uncharacterized protein n=1 Tax=Botrytis deweyae TaxID=2478750 RepID=A0ABQ7IFB7_9HELO|nr:uncharacterized protein EAE98_008535 [Botrytis deweyae]KAF7921688.1 hypothetical protein EAE98_008535 [Botrytis deweyae]
MPSKKTKSGVNDDLENDPMLWPALNPDRLTHFEACLLTRTNTILSVLQNVFQDREHNRITHKKKTTRKRTKDYEADEDDEEEEAEEFNGSKKTSNREAVVVSYNDMSEELRMCLSSKTHEWVQKNKGNRLCFNLGTNGSAMVQAKAWYSHLKHWNRQ